MNNFGYGSMTPTDTTSEFNKLQFIINQTLAQVRTMVLVQVMAATASGAVAQPGTVNVQPLVKMLDGNGNAFPHGTILNIPVFRLQGGSYAIILDPQVGDIGWMAVADRDISAVKASPGLATPGSLRRFDLADGVYMGALFGASPTQYIQMNASGITIVDANGNKIQMSSTGVTIFDNNSNQIQMKAGAVNVVAPVLQVNGTPLTVP